MNKNVQIVKALPRKLSLIKAWQVFWLALFLNAFPLAEIEKN
jgi:hypothetical protein